MISVLIFMKYDSNLMISILIFKKYIKKIQQVYQYLRSIFDVFGT